MDTMDAVCQQCGRQIRIVKGTQKLCRACIGPNQDKTAGGQFFRKGMRIIALGQKKNSKPKKWMFW